MVYPELLLNQMQIFKKTLKKINLLLEIREKLKEKNTDIKKHVEVSNSLRDNSLITIKIKSDINNLCQKKRLKLL